MVSGGRIFTNHAQMGPDVYNKKSVTVTCKYRSFFLFLFLVTLHQEMHFFFLNTQFANMAGCISDEVLCVTDRSKRTEFRLQLPHF